MPPLENDSIPGQSQAIKAEFLYLLNLSFLPVIAFLILLRMYTQLGNDTPALARSHIKQTINASIWAGLLMIAINGLIIFFSGVNDIWTWMYVIIYFTSIHSALIIFGVIGISKAQGGRFYAYPYINKTCNDQDIP
jgi:hypothetical protein